MKRLLQPRLFAARQAQSTVSSSTGESVCAVYTRLSPANSLPWHFMYSRTMPKNSLRGISTRLSLNSFFERRAFSRNMNFSSRTLFTSSANTDMAPTAAAVSTAAAIMLSTLNENQR